MQNDQLKDEVEGVEQERDNLQVLIVLIHA
jgi:hypothetical protein